MPSAKITIILLPCKAVTSAYGGLARQQNHHLLVATALNDILCTLPDEKFARTYAVKSNLFVIFLWSKHPDFGILNKK